MPNIPVNNCCGCTACFNACPKGAISMVPDEEGFVFPSIKEELCVNCGKCEQVCPIMSAPEIPQEYTMCAVAQNTDNSVLKESTSGGFIDALYKYVLSELGGYAAGVAYDENFMPTHVLTDSYEKAKEFRNSKYAQSDLSDIFTKIKELLTKGRTVIFTGTPCQVAGLKSFLEVPYNNLITVDLVCRSIPSRALWRKYLDFQEKKYHSKISSVSCRKKTYGYHSGTLEIEFENSKHYSGSNRIDYYMKAFHSDICSRISCYNCNFKTPHRCSDFTVFDCWEPQSVVLTEVADDDRGFSNVLTHTENGKNILENMGGINLFPADAEKMFKFTGGMESSSIAMKKARETLYKDINFSGFDVGIKKYIKVTPKDRIIEKLKPLRYFLKRRLSR